MSKIKTLDDLNELRQKARRDMRVRLPSGIKITVGMGTCGIAAGARKTMEVLLKELHRHRIDAHVTPVDCMGMCASEPLVGIQMADGATITYGRMQSQLVPRLIEDHILHGRIITDWVVTHIPPKAVLSKEEFANG